MASSSAGGALVRLVIARPFQAQRRRQITRVSIAVWAALVQ
jgi:hypothetical protein